MGVRLLVWCVLVAVIVSPAFGQGALAAFNVVSPFTFDPGRTNLVASAWLTGIGCPTTDPACAAGDTQDQRTEGLLLVKTGPTSTVAAALAELLNVRGTVLEELGYDIRKTGGPASPLGSHCGAGAPRFNVVSEGVTYFIGCNSPPATTTVIGAGWTRLRWGGAGNPLMAFGPGGFVDISGAMIDRILIVFDEGQDTNPDFFGAAVLDNVAVNGAMVGRGSGGR
jgi:hypothetical protein